MPFDAMVATRQQTIAEALDHHGLVPVPWKSLAAHKQKQLRRFGPSFWYRHQTAVVLALVAATPLVGIFAGAMHGSSGNATALAFGGGLAWLCLVAAITGTGLVRLRAGSHWRERWVPASQLGDLGVPEPIAATALLLQLDMPGTTLTLGELMREEVVLDPYLVIEQGNERICLGIWDNEQVIACAGQPAGVAPDAARAVT